MRETPLLGVTTVCYPSSVSPRFTLERALKGIRAAGLDYVELVAIPGYCPHLQPDEMGEGEIDALRDLLARYELSPSAINVAANLTTEAGVAYLGEAMRVASALGAGTVVTHIEQTETPEGEAGFRRLLPSILGLAERYGMVVALEVHGGLINTGSEGVALLEEIGSERLKLTYDMANVVYFGGIRPEEDLDRMGDAIGRFVGHVHLKDKANMRLRDYNFPPFGTGILDFATVLALLEQGGYRGPMTLEVELDGQPESPELVDEALVASYQYLQQFLGVEA